MAVVSKQRSLRAFDDEGRVLTYQEALAAGPIDDDVKPCANSDPDFPAPAFPLGTIINSLCICADSNGVFWQIDPKAGLIKQVMQMWPKKGVDEFEFNGRIFREVKEG